MRLARNLAYTNEVVHLTNWGAGNALTIAGGYDNCADAVPSGFTVVDGTGASPVVEVDTTGGNSSTVTLRALDLQGSGVRGVLVEGNSIVTLDHVWIHLNGGGGLDVGTGAYVDVQSGSTISSNSTSGFGGGIRCFGGEVLLAARVEANQAQAGGGGLYADSGCILTLADIAEVIGNSAPDGAGLYAAGASFVTADGGTFGIALYANQASDQGGGVYATGSATVVSLVNVQIEDNQAGSMGGGLFATAGAIIGVGRDAGPCRPSLPCSTLAGNWLPATGDFFGAAARVEAGAGINIYQTQLTGSDVSHNTLGSILSVTGSGSLLRLEGDVLWDNEGATLVHVGGGASAQIAFVTASGNGTPAGIARPLSVDGTGSSATVNSSIFWPNAPFSSAAGGMIAEADCLIVSSPAGLPAGATRVSVVDPLFHNAAAGELRVVSSSPAVDFCDATMYAPTLRDVDFELRGFDRADNPNGSPGAASGVYDLGFDEMRGLFIDGFEAGSTAEWSTDWP